MNTQTQSPVTLTERAATHIRGFLDKSAASGMRLGIKPTGCSGFSYVVETVDEPGASDLTFETRGISICIDNESFKYLQGSEIDYVREGLNEGFRFSNPNAADTCGCGESFNV